MKKLVIVFLLISLISACSSKMSEDKYITLANQYLDNTEQALGEIYNVLDTVITKEEYSQLEKPTEKMIAVLNQVIQKLDTQQTPEKYLEERENLKLLFQSELEFANSLKLYSESGKLEHLSKIEQTSSNLIKYYYASIFTKDEFRESENKSTIDYNQLFNKVKEVGRMNEDEYLLKIKDSIDYFYTYIKSLSSLLSVSGVVSIKNGADTLYEGVNLLQSQLNMMKPPLKYEGAHNNYAQTVQYLVSGADGLKKYSRNPTSSISEGINTSIAELEKSIKSVDVLKELVRINLK